MEIRFGAVQITSSMPSTKLGCVSGIQEFVLERKAGIYLTGWAVVDILISLNRNDEQLRTVYPTPYISIDVYDFLSI